MTREYFFYRLIVSFLLLFLAACTPSDFHTERQEFTMMGDDAVQARSGDGQNLYVDVTINFNIAPENMELVRAHWPEGDYLEQLIRPIVRHEVREVFAQYEAQVLFGFGGSTSTLAEIAQEFEDAVRNELADEDFIARSVLIRMINFDEAFVEAMEAMQIATLTFRSYEDLQGTATQATTNLLNAEASETATNTP
jgi:regulator of protease activity HflC (stomatin/prohibitin superfamily)